MSEYIDAQWYEAYTGLTTEVPVYKVLRTVPDIDAQRDAFVDSGYAINPNLQPEIDLDALAGREIEASKLLSRLTEEEVEPLIVDAYVPVLQSKFGGFALQQAAAAGDVDAFVSATREVYGDVDRDTFGLVTGFYSDWASRHLHEPTTSQIKQAAQIVLDTLPVVSSANAALGWPNATEFAIVQDLYADFFNEMYRGVELPERSSGDTVKNIIERVLDNLGYKNFSVEPQDKGVRTMSTSHKFQYMKYPPEEIYTRERLKGLLGHEGRIHLEDTELGLQQPMRIVARGLAGHLVAAEGRGVMVEQCAYPSLEAFMQTRRFMDIAYRHLTIGLARGVDGGDLRDFKEVFAIAHPLNELWELVQTPHEPEAAASRAFDKTWEILTQRTLKGVVGKGAAYFKDKIYAEGNLAQLWLHINHPEVKPYINKGSYDLTNPEHRRILKQIGTIPLDLLADIL